MTKIMTFTAITIALLLIPVSGFAFAAPWNAGEPFEILSAALAELEQRVQALEQQISELTFTQTDPNETVVQVNMAANPTAPPLVVSDTDDNDVFTVFPDGAIRIGFNTVTINPDGSAPGLEIKEENIADKSIGAEKLKDKTIGQDKIQDKAIGKEKIQDKAIGREKIEDKAVGKGQIADKAVGKGQLEDKAVGRSQLDNRSVGKDQLDENSVTSFHIEDGTITESDVASGVFVTRSGGTIEGTLSLDGLLEKSHKTSSLTLSGVPAAIRSDDFGIRHSGNTLLVGFHDSTDVLAVTCMETAAIGTSVIFTNGNSDPIMIASNAPCIGTEHLVTPDTNDLILAPGETIALIYDGTGWLIPGKIDAVVNLESAVPSPFVTDANTIGIGESSNLLKIGIDTPLECIEEKPFGTAIVMTFVSSDETTSGGTCDAGFLPLGFVHPGVVDAGHTVVLVSDGTAWQILRTLS